MYDFYLIYNMTQINCDMHFNATYTKCLSMKNSLTHTTEF